MKIPFCKMNGCGNDFIIIDNRSGQWDTLMVPEFAGSVCTRKLSVGADGLIFIVPSEKADFGWRFFNSDGSRAEMCGNGARCAALYAFLNNIAAESLSFETDAGIINAEIKGASVNIQLTGGASVEDNIRITVNNEHYDLYFINTGVPHVVCFADDINRIDVRQTGAHIRFHERFRPAGTNVNFVTVMPGNLLSIRTYERGVEDETLACGTGTVAAALVALFTGRAVSPVQVRTQSAEIMTVITEAPSPPFGNVFLEGGVQVVYEAQLWWNHTGG